MAAEDISILARQRGTAGNAALLWLLPAVLYYGFLLTAGSSGLFAPVMHGLTFNSMLLHLLHGQFDVDPAAIGDEGFVHAGATYAYFGVFPALFRAAFLWLPNFATTDFTRLGCVVAVTLMTLFKMLSALTVWRAADSRRDARLLVLLTVAILASGPQIEFLRPSIYQEVVLWDDAAAAAFVYLLLRGLTREEGFTPRLLAALATAAGICLLVRVSTALGLYVAFGLVWLRLAPAAARRLRDADERAGRIGAAHRRFCRSDRVRQFRALGQSAHLCRHVRGADGRALSGAVSGDAALRRVQSDPHRLRAQLLFPAALDAARRRWRTVVGGVPATHDRQRRIAAGELFRVRPAAARSRRDRAVLPVAAARGARARPRAVRRDRSSRAGRADTVRAKHDAALPGGVLPVLRAVCVSRLRAACDGSDAANPARRRRGFRGDRRLARDLVSCGYVVAARPGGAGAGATGTGRGLPLAVRGGLGRLPAHPI